MNKQIKIDIPSTVEWILNTLNTSGYEAYVVGGCVRDAIMHIPPHDWDICTSAFPEEIMEVFKDCKIIPTGLKHGTITVVIHGTGYEITTYRKDGDYSDGRHPDNVEFTNDLHEDLKRRDFTMNAIAYADGEWIDPFGGRDDIEKGVIRCVGNAVDRFDEDSLRIMRALRFAAQMNFYIVFATSCAIRSICTTTTNLQRVSAERIREEFCKIVKANGWVQIARYPEVISTFIPEIYGMVGFQQNNPYHDFDVWTHTLNALICCDSYDLITKLAVFFHDIGKPHCYQDDGNLGVRHFKGHGQVSADMTDAIMRRLKFDNNTREKVIELVKYHDATFVENKKSIRKWLNKIGKEQFYRLLNVRIADIKGQKIMYDQARVDEIGRIVNLTDEVIYEVLNKDSCFQLKDLKVNGRDLIEIGFVPGKHLGKVLNILLEQVMENSISNNKEVLLEVAKGYL